MPAFVLCLVLGLVLQGCGDDDPLPAPEFPRATVCDAVDDDAAGELAVEGEVALLSDLGGAGHPGSQLGFVLTGDACSILVLTPDRSVIAGLESGGVLTVHGVLADLDATESERVLRVLGLPAGADSIGRALPAPAALGPGAPYIDAYSITGDAT